METVSIELWAIVDEAGDYQIGKEESEAQERYDEDFDNTGPKRCIKVMVNLPKPRTVTLIGTAPGEGEATLTVQ